MNVDCISHGIFFFFLNLVTIREYPVWQRQFQLAMERYLIKKVSILVYPGQVVRAVGGRVPVLLDGGIRRGTDVFKTLALGAQAVLVRFSPPTVQLSEVWALCCTSLSLSPSF